MSESPPSGFHSGTLFPDLIRPDDREPCLGTHQSCFEHFSGIARHCSIEEDRCAITLTSAFESRRCPPPSLSYDVWLELQVEGRVKRRTLWPTRSSEAIRWRE